MKFEKKPIGLHALFEDADAAKQAAAKKDSTGLYIYVYIVSFKETALVEQKPAQKKRRVARMKARLCSIRDSYLPLCRLQCMTWRSCAPTLASRRGLWRERRMPWRITSEDGFYTFLLKKPVGKPFLRERWLYFHCSFIEVSMKLQLRWL